MLERQEAPLGSDHPNTLRTRDDLVVADESRGLWAEAESLRHDASARRRKSEGPAAFCSPGSAGTY
jgi:hypothetical protein